MPRAKQPGHRVPNDFVIVNDVDTGIEHWLHGDILGEIKQLKQQVE